ncbi:MAG: (2Fe-2S) ferredoxin domain-containing protein [Gammaproteobacteria bacterium]|nr:(2Fe-2S) ferredoxin domain-containing protein [Gammaproteobacteria bacterium]MBU1776096.1 (2Fe-2S) ferredoxin domain-containing protein [Gammaproteobacteria bacterium]MBU1969415.1 (2Fe-2S) ferredoxin domain-containing protein [Gammaproteobacteria bacterium]
MPKPAKHVFLCTQNRPAGHPRGSCGQNGCAEVAEEFMQQWQQRQCFPQVQVTPSSCIGPCSMGPNILVYPEGVLYNKVTKADVSAIFDEHLLGGTPVERLKAPADLW